jgi:integrase
VHTARPTTNQRIARLVRLFAWAVSEELIPVAVHQALATVTPLPRGTKAAKDWPEIGPAPEQDVRDTLPCLSTTVRAMALLQLATGMRPGEVCSLERAWIDQVGLSVEGTTVWVYRPGGGDRHKTARHGSGKARWVFPSTAGGPYRTSTYCDQVREACRRAGVPAWKPNALRKAAATDLQDRLGIDTARAALGHTTSKVTLGTYARADLKIAARGAAKLG